MMNTHKEKSHTDIVKTFLTLQYEGKIEEAFQHYAAEDFTWVVSTRENKDLTTAIPWAGLTHKGLEGYKTLTGLLFGEFESLAFEPQEFHEVNQKVFVVGYFKFRHRMTGKLAESDFIGLFDMREGKIAGGQFFENTYAVAVARQP